MKDIIKMTLAELENYIAEYKTTADWIQISRNPNLTEEFIERHVDEVNWPYISICQKLSEEFIENHADKVESNCTILVRQTARNKQIWML